MPSPSSPSSRRHGAAPQSASSSAPLVRRVALSSWVCRMILLLSLPARCRASFCGGSGSLAAFSSADRLPWRASGPAACSPHRSFHLGPHRRNSPVAAVMSKDDDGTSSSPPPSDDAVIGSAELAPDDRVPVPPPSPEPRKSHCVTICAVPPPSAVGAWEALTEARRALRDPGFYRWPPHANILYPFLELKSMKKRGGRRSEDTDAEEGNERGEDSLFEEDMLDKLEQAAAEVEPFEVSIERLGTFGGKSRGVLWAYPRSYYRDTEQQNKRSMPGKEKDEGGGGAHEDFCDPTEPLIRLQASLEEEFPTCTEQRKQRMYHPHITLSHFETLDDALAAQRTVEEGWETVVYPVEEVYVLRRVGDEGQFEIAATVSLGRSTEAHKSPGDGSEEQEESKERTQRGRIIVHDPPVAFPAMPSIEEPWVLEERMKLKARRNNNSSWRGRGRKKGGRRRRNGRSVDRGPSRTQDTPEVIAAKRAERKAKREAREAEERRAAEEIARALGEE